MTTIFTASSTQAGTQSMPTDPEKTRGLFFGVMFIIISVSTIIGLALIGTIIFWIRKRWFSAITPAQQTEQARVELFWQVNQPRSQEPDIEAGNVASDPAAIPTQLPVPVPASSVAISADFLVIPAPSLSPEFKNIPLN
ncbi:hypothetical protein B0J11DRAFT_578776 [Dendryphion nanum]|uniref:Uncharacterized protein n=1 Tax=Dendryphion nanum TaxID=256645 RepID=A0A9P9E0M3_9PLEO|nr:hypothetical protein B0J11DRAFT_578776 [Dendryphion nanum]